MDYEKKYKEALKKAKGIIKYYEERNRDEASIEDLETIFPELKENEDERIREALVKFHGSTIDIDGIKGSDIVAWLEKQSKQKSNPYSGTSFEYNGHTWGMCARDGGVEILVDGKIKERVFLDNKPHDARENLTLDGDLMQADCMIVEQEPAWSEEDETNLQGIIDEIQANKNNAPDYDIETYDRFLKWLKSLKERIKGV